MTDVPDGSGQIPRRSPRVSDGNSAVSGGLAIVLAVVAVVAGFLILRSISDSGAESADFPDPGGVTDAPDSGSATATTQPTDTLPELPTTTTEPPIVTAGAVVVVANANGQGGSAGAMSRALETGPGFEMGEPTNASASLGGPIEDSIIYYEADVAAARDVAESLGRVLGGVGTIAPVPDSGPPTADGTFDGDVLLMLGIDKANKTLEELNPELSTGGDVVTVTNPDPAAEATTETTAAG